MMRISLFSSKMSFLIIAFFAFPFIIETPYILQLWLKMFRNGVYVSLDLK